MSRRLTERSIDHVLLERGEVANSWRTERWPGMRLLTPNWQTRLPGFAYQGDDPDGFMAAGQVADLITGYAATVEAPVQAATTVQSLRPGPGGGYEVVTDQGTWTAPTVVLASGACNVASVPACAAGVPPGLTTLTPLDYKGADRLPEGGVLVVGPSATGVQLAQEIHRSGRPVTLAAGEHVRLPRLYRGRDIFWWMEAAGVLDERYDEVDDIVRARHVPSPQLAGAPARTTLDLNTLTDAGVRIVGRLGRIADGVAQFAGSLANVCALADLKLNRLLGTLDEWAREHVADGEMDGSIDGPERFEPTRVDPRPTTEIDLRAGEFETIIWATGYRPDYSWLDLPVLDRKGYVRHDGGVITDVSGAYVLGMPFLRRRRSTFIHGAVADTDDLAAHLHAYLHRAPAQRPGR